MTAPGWFDFDFLRVVCQHTVSVIVAVVSFALIGLAVHYLVPAGTLKVILEAIEGVTIVGLLLWLVIIFASLLWQRRPWDGGASVVLA
jgi:hypothetical protein